jgi:hypothetical protein
VDVSRTLPDGSTQKGNLTISIDRERINPDSSLNLVYKVEGFFPPDHIETPAQFAQFLDSLEAKVRVSRVRDGVSLPSRETTGYEPVIPPLRHYQLGTIAFPVTLKQGQTLLPLSIEAGDVVAIGFELAGVGLTLPLMSAFELPVVAEPINPPTPRALALLRKSASGVVDCPRFAWSPKAARIELVNPDDLFQPIVRRRGVFRWIDTIRVGENVEYAVQAIAPSGATLIPQVFSAPQ